MEAADDYDEAAEICDELQYLARVFDWLVEHGRLLLDGTPESQQWPTTTDAVQQVERGLAQTIEAIC